MEVFKSRLLGKKLIAYRTLEIELERPANFAYAAGQYANLSFVSDPSRRAELTRTLTISSAPYEKTVTFIVRESDSEFKKRLFGTPVGTEFEIEGPFGDFTLDQADGNDVLFIAGGMGISPFTSMIKESLAEGEPHKMNLIYLCRRPEEAPFVIMFKALDEQHDNFKFTSLATQRGAPESQTPEERRQRTEEMVDPYLAENDREYVYVAGPKGMVSAMVELLNKKHVGKKVLTGEFLG